jgi:hypothetical protein
MNNQIKLRWLAGLGAVMIVVGIVRLAIGTPLPPDSDNDGLLDSWEIQYFGNLSQGPNGDPDGDGLTNLQEYQGGTNPTIYNSSYGLAGASALQVFTPLTP